MINDWLADKVQESVALPLFENCSAGFEQDVTRPSTGGRIFDPGPYRGMQRRNRRLIEGATERWD
jgi:hypothetical protein